MKTIPYQIVPVHERPDLHIECCKLVNSEWPSSEGRRLRTLRMSCENFPVCLMLLKDDKVIGYCKISLLPYRQDSCFVESVVIDRQFRSQGLGSKLLQGAEEFMLKKGIKNTFLSTRGQEGFYSKNGYSICEAADLMKAWDPFSIEPPFLKSSNSQAESTGPPPPPLPNSAFIATGAILRPDKTYMLKRL